MSKDYWMTIENKDPGIDAKPKIVQIILRVQLHNLILDDSWIINWGNTNNWVGTGYGKTTYKNSKLYFWTGQEENEVYWMVWNNINYPEDCRTKDGEDWKTGSGEYISRYTNRWCAVEWSNRNIVPER